MSKHFILNDKYALRSFSDKKNVLLIKGQVVYRPLFGDEYAIANLCDGIYSFSEEEINSKPFQLLLSNEIIRPAKPQEQLTEWQKYKECNNHHWPIIDLRLTERCNYNCPHCFNAADINTNTDEWSYEEFLKLLDEAEACGVVGFSFTGGEPMVHPHFLDFVKEVYKRGMFLRRLMTNARFITQDLLDEFKTIGCNPMFQISFDGVGTHDIMRGCKGAEKVTLDAIKLCVDNGFHILINTQVNRLTKDTLLKTVEVLEDIGVSSVRLIRTNETPRWAKLQKNATLSTKEYYDFCFEFLSEFGKKEHKIEVSFWKLGKFNFENKRYMFDACTMKSKKYSAFDPLCSTCSQEICIAANGNIYPCHQASGLADSQGVFYGNVKKQGLQNAINGELYMTEALMTAGQMFKNSKECSACNHFRQCMGGCRIFSKYILGGLYKPSPFSCQLYNDNFEEKVATVLPDWENLVPVEK